MTVNKVPTIQILVSEFGFPEPLGQLYFVVWFQLPSASGLEWNIGVGRPRRRDKWVFEVPWSCSSVKMMCFMFSERHCLRK